MVRENAGDGLKVSEVCKTRCASTFVVALGSRVYLQITGVRSTLEKKVLPKLRFLESILQPINRLPKDIFILIPCFFTREEENYDIFPMNIPLITMTHVCRSWRTVLLSTPSLWTQIDFSTFKSKQAKGFIGRSGKQLLDIYQLIESEDDEQPFLSTTLRNIYRLGQLEITSFHEGLERVLTPFTRPAPELKHLEITNYSDTAHGDVKFHGNIFGGRLPKLLSLSLHYLYTDFRTFNFPSLVRFDFTTGTKTVVRDLTSFFERCPLLEFIQICLFYTPQLPTAPPRKRVRLAALKELRLDQTASTCGLLDHLILPECTEMMLKGQFTDEKFDSDGHPAAQIHKSSIDHLPVTRDITKAVAMPNSCVLSGPNGDLRFWCFRENRANFNAKFFTSFSPISISGIRELLVGPNTEFPFDNLPSPWEQTVDHARGAFGVLTKVEDLTIVSCKTEPFFTALGAAMDGPILLPGLRRLTIYIGCGDLDVPALVRCAEARFENSRPLGEVTVIFENELNGYMIQEVEFLRGFVEDLSCRVGASPELKWESKDGDAW